MKRNILRSALCLLLAAVLCVGCAPAPAVPEAPAAPQAPVAPEVPAEPQAPTEPAPPVPENPDIVPIVPETPAEPVTPEEPQEPVTPEEPKPAEHTPAPAPKYDYLVGFGREDITPDAPVPLAGYGATSKRINETVDDSLYASCVAVTDRDGKSLLLFSLDIINARDAVVKALRNALSEELDLPKDNIIVSTTHTHSGPDLSNTKEAFINLYTDMLISSAVEAGIAAWEDRKSADLYIASGNADGLNFVRHYRHEDGTYSGPGFGDSTTSIVGHAGAPDPEMRLIRFKRQGAKDVLMMNWQAHATMNSYQVPNKGLSADFITGVRDYLESKLDCSFLYFQGAAGDLMPTSNIAGETKTRDIYEFGQLLGDVAIAALQQEKKLPAGPIKLSTFSYSAKINHTDDHLQEPAATVVAHFSETQNNSESSRLARSLGLISRHHAASIIRRAGLGESQDLSCSVFSIGGVGFAVSPNELFSDMGIAIRAGSPYEMTFILGYTNNSNGYVPTHRAYGYYSYEVGCSNFAEGTAEEHAAFMSQKLTQLQQQ